jgi:rhodanese-related sulfurtransferase
MRNAAVWMVGLLLVWGGVQASDPDYASPEQVEGAVTVEVEEARRLHAAGVAFVDVRNPRLYARRHIPGAIHLDLKDRYTPETLAAVVAKDQPFVVYCSGVRCSRSHRAAAFAVEWGYSQVRYFRGGIVDWRDAGLPMDSTTPPPE